MDRDEFNRRAQRRVETVDVPGFGPVRLRSLSVREVKALVAAAQAEDPNGEAMAVAAAVVGDDGQPLFTEADIPEINEWDGRALSALADAVLRFNTHSKAAQEAREKNS